MLSPMEKLARSKFRVKIKSLASEAKIIRHEESRRSGWVRSSLHVHRVCIVRDEQRHTLIAYAFYRGVPYAAVEQSCRVLPDAMRVTKIVKSLAMIYGSEVIDDVRSWLQVSLKAEEAA